MNMWTTNWRPIFGRCWVWHG